MEKAARCQSEIEAVLAKRHDLGGDLWTTPDHRLMKGGPFSTLEGTRLLLELGMDPTEPVLEEVTELIFSCLRTDGRFKLTPSGALYPCQTLNALNVLCHLGRAADFRLQKTYQHLFEIQHSDGGWRCLKFSYGKGPETEFSNPGPTLTALDAFRFAPELGHEPELERALEFLLQHWTSRAPLGPCHYGIGTLFMQLEFPFRTYNLFYYVYVLSFYKYARHDVRYLAALNVLESKLRDGQVVVERVNARLAGFSFCQKDEVSTLATERYLELRRNLATDEG